MSAFVRIGGHALTVDRGQQAAKLVVAQHIRRLMTGTDPGRHGRDMRSPAGGLGVLGQLPQRQRVAPHRGRSQVTAVEKPVQCFFGDQPVRIALPPAVLGELAQHPLRDFEPVSAGVTHSDQIGDQALKRALMHHAHPRRHGR